MQTLALDLSASPGETPAIGYRAPAAAGRVSVTALLRIAIGLLIIANLGRIPVLDSGKKEAPILFNDLWVVAVVMVAALAALRRRRLVLDAPASLALAFAGFAAASTVLAIPRFDLTGFQFAFSIAYLVRWLVYFGVYVAAINFIRADDVPAVWKALERTVLVFAAFGIVQSFFLPGFAQMVYPDSELFTDWDPQGHRLVSTILDPNYAGMLILTVLLVLLSGVAAGVPVARWKLILLFAALTLTVSRSSFLALLVGGITILSITGLSRRLLRFGGLLVLLTLPFLPLLIGFAATYSKFSLDFSALTRVLSWIRAIQIFADHPLLGVGFNTYGFVQDRYGFTATGNSSFGLDGSPLFIAVLTGLPGLLLFFGVFALVLRRCRRIWRSGDATPVERGLGIGVAAVTAALLVHSMFLNSLLYPFLMEPMWVLWAMTLPVLQEIRRREAAGSPFAVGSGSAPMPAPAA